MNQRGFFFPIAMVVSTVLMFAAVELTYIAKIQTESVNDLESRLKLYCASQSGTEILRAWSEIDSSFGDEKFSNYGTINESELHKFKIDGIDVRILLLQSTMTVPRTLIESEPTISTSTANLPCRFFVSVAEIDDSRFETLERIETSFGAWYWFNSRWNWFEFYR